MQGTCFVAENGFGLQGLCPMAYNILTEFGIHMKPVKPIKMCLNETYSSAQVGKHMSDMFPIKNGLQQADALSPLLSILL